MTRKLSPGRRVAHALLLVAALLQFGAAVLGPRAHLAAATLARVPAWQADEPTGPEGSPLHDESNCVVCHTLTVAIFLPAASGTPFAPRSLDGRAPDPAASYASPSLAFPSARSPPAS